jgi:hypothetical protein
MDRLQSFKDSLWDPLDIPWWDPWWDPFWDPLWDPSDQSGISTTCDGPHVTRDTHLGLVTRGCPRGWLGCSVRCLALSLACPSTHSRDEATVLTCWFIDFLASWSVFNVIIVVLWTVLEECLHVSELLSL